LHKTDVGVVKVGVSTPKEVRATYGELLTKAKKADRHARIDGVMVCEMVTGGVDTLIGVSTDELFGPVITFGLGGVFVEVFGDVAFRVPPFDEDEARRAITELKGLKILQGARGQKPADVDALIGTIMKVQRLAMDLAAEVRELDINPLVVKPRGAVALDALIVKNMVVKK
jgi:acyl-CoA synthetase (NDP forming)